LVANYLAYSANGAVLGEQRVFRFYRGLTARALYFSAYDAIMNWLQLELFEQDMVGMEPMIPGRLVVSDEGTGEYVHLDMYRGQTERLRISVTRNTLRLYAQKLLEAANRDMSFLSR